jgi:hypothetical protein
MQQFPCKPRAHNRSENTNDADEKRQNVEPGRKSHGFIFDKKIHRKYPKIVTGY